MVALLTHPADQAEPGLVGQVVVEQDEVDAVAFQRGQRLGSAVRARRDPEPGNLADVRRVDLGDAEVVVHDQDVDHRSLSFKVACLAR